MGIIISSVLGIVAIIVAMFGVKYAKDQVNLAKKTKSETEKLLEKINKRTEEIKKISEDTKKSIDEQINTVLKNFDPKVQSESKMMEAFLGAAINDPAVLKEVLKMASEQEKDT